MNDLFYFLGGILAVLALVVSFIGIRSENFPSSRGALLGGLGAFAALVVASCAFAVALSADEHDKHATEYAEYRAEQDQQEADAASTSNDPNSSAADPSESQTPVDVEPNAADAIDLAAAADSSLAFDQDKLEAKAGAVSIDLTNPSPLPHNVAIEVDGETVAQSPTVVDGADAVASADLDPGEYTFYCSIPGHREGGMEGTLTVK